MKLSIRKPVAAYLAAFLLLTGCGPELIGIGVLVGLRAVAERDSQDLVTDIRIDVDINGLLAEQVPKSYQTLAIDVFEGRVLLTGTALEVSEAAKAVEVAESVNGVREVINEIQIRESGGPRAYAEDVAISGVIQLRLAELNETELTTDIEMEVVNGIVYMVGVAPDQASIDRIADIVRRVNGVERVVLHLLTVDDPRRLAEPKSVDDVEPPPSGEGRSFDATLVLPESPDRGGTPTG